MNVVDAALIVTLARSLDWPALVVDGDAQLADLIIVAGASDGLTAVNRRASHAALGGVSVARLLSRRSSGSDSTLI